MLRKWGAVHNLKKIRLFSVVALIIAAPSLAFADTTVASQAYVDTYKEAFSNKLNGTSTSGQKIGDLTAGSGAGQDQTMYPSAAAVKQYSQAKPTSGVANGKVLSYTGTDANTNVSADYIKVPQFDPSGTLPATPTFSYIWVQ